MRRSTTTTTRRRLTAAVAVLVAAAGLSACTGTSTEDPSAPVTITFWHGWSLKSDVAALDTYIQKFEKAHPNIKVETTPNVSDDKILQGLRTSNGPDVVSSFTTNAVGALCQGGLVDLNPLLKKDGIDKKKVFIPTRIDYTSYKGNQCTLPFLGDAVGLYYDKKAFADAGIASPPVTWSEFTADAVALTKRSGSSYESLGFMPSFQGYESDVGTWMHQWNPTYYDSHGKANLASDPAVADFFRYTASLQKALGGYPALQSYRSTFGEEFSAENPFEIGKVAMAFDGEWRIALLKDDKSNIDYGVAPLPVPDDQRDAYGKGYLTGTIIGLSHRSAHQQAAWELIKFLTTDTDGMVAFGNAIQNLPSTNAALKSPQLSSDPAFQTFLKISANPESGGVPASKNGGEYLNIITRFANQWESGKARDLKSGLTDVDRQIDQANAQAGG